jgi:hypothetical protein
MKSILCCILGLSIILNGCMSTASGTSTPVSAAQQQQDQQADEIIGIAVGSVVLLTLVGLVVASANSQKIKAKRQADEAQFQACIGKTKADVYNIYGPPDNIVDDGQADGGTILIYQKTVTEGDDKTGIITTTHRKLFYLNKDNIVTAVKRDTH